MVRQAPGGKTTAGVVPGWVNILAGGVPGAVAAYDFVTQQSWMQGNPSGGLSAAGYTVDANGLYPTAKVLFAEGPWTAANQPGSILINMSGATDTSGGIALELGGTTSKLFASSGNALTLTLGGHSIVATLGSGTLAGTTAAAIGFDATGKSIVANGGALVSDTNAGAYAGSSLFFFDILASSPIGGHIQSVVLWSSRLPVATLQQLAP
jgi:hypothetical protein